MEMSTKLAGDVVGTPAWQLELMNGTESAEMWESLNAPEQEEQEHKPLDGFSFEELNYAQASLAVALGNCDSIIKFANDAAAEIPGTAEAEQLMGLCESVDDIKPAVERIRAAMLKVMHPWKEFEE